MSSWDLRVNSKTCLKRPHSKRPKIGFQDQLTHNAGQNYCRWSKGSILQYFRPSLSYPLSLRPLFWLCLSGHLRQVLLYKKMIRYRHILDIDLPKSLHFRIDFRWTSRLLLNKVNIPLSCLKPASNHKGANIFFLKIFSVFFCNKVFRA